MALENRKTENTPPHPPGPVVSSATTRGKSLWVNYVSLLSGTVTAKGFALLTVLMLTRYLGVEDFGRYSLIFSYWALLNTLVDFGGSHIMGREIAREPQHLRPSIESVIYIRLMGCVVFLPVGILLANVLGLGTDLMLVAFLGILAGFEAFYDLYFSATMQLDSNAKARFFSSMANVILMGLAILLKLPLIAIVLMAMLNPLLKLLYDYRYAPFKVRLHAPDWTRIRRIAMDGWPLWMMGLQYLLLARIDTFLLQVLSPTGEHELGIYSAAFRLSEVMALLINAMCPALLPLLVKHMHEPDRIGFLAGTSTRLILSGVMMLTLFIFGYAPWIVKVYGPGYAEATLCMRILIWSQALVAINTVCYQLLVIYNAQGRRPVLISSIFMTLLNIGLNLWLIPGLHAAGASWATVVTEAAIAISMLCFLHAYTPLRLVRDVLLIEGLALLSCLPVVMFGGNYGWMSILLFALLVWGLKLLTPEALRTLARERLHEAPTNPT
jgi:O-antigen/teichoic acid export membrane protein